MRDFLGFGQGIQILVEEIVNGKRVHAKGQFQFVLQCGMKRNCVVEAKYYDMNRGVAQILVGCEVLADVEDLDTAYGIVTTYTDWMYFKRENDKILRCRATLDLDKDDVPTLQSLQTIAEIIHTMLWTPWDAEQLTSEAFT
ncbi:Crinkler (CRN) family protein [Thraustotheca clavata]|uniref:Crinkler (CRN) family protein n=1 Tax=Thraustotheca clavata TaxID=74557 RepID=A0A1V9ZWP6_9STRA|nr:Crinkler (CRN) family protein [Thraustotheca clavata]